MNTSKTNRTAHFIRNVVNVFNFHCGKILIISFLLFCPVSMPGLLAQGIDDLGVVWSKTFGQGNIANIKSNPDGTYTACGTVSALTGLVIEFDESGNELRRGNATLPQYYIDSHSDTLLAASAAAYFRVAFKTDDGGILAFGFLVNRGAPNDEKQPNWDANSQGSQYLTNGAWIVKFNSNMEVIKDTLVRGMAFYNGWRTSDDNFVLGGFDVSYRGINGNSADSITLLRKYDQNGNMLLSNKNNFREIRDIYKFPDNDNFIALTPDRLLRIDQNLVITAYLLSTLNLPGINTGANPSTSTVSPAANGGVFIPAHLYSVSQNAYLNYLNGFGFYKVDGSNLVQYHKIIKPSDTTFTAPLLLPGNDDPLKYVGVATVQQGTGNGVSVGTVTTVASNLMYELTDDGTFNYRIGNPYPAGTALKAVSLTDGFFSCGVTSDGQAAIAKLSTCANFRLVTGTTDETLISSGTATIPGRTVTSMGRKGTVTGGWTLTDITPSGQATSLSGTVSGSGFTIPPQTVSLLPGKTFALLRYTVTAVDSYTTGSIPQTCQQTQNILVRIYYSPDNVVSTDCAVPITEMDWSLNTTPIMLDNNGNKDVSVYQTPYVGDLDGDGYVEIVVAESYSAPGGHNFSSSWCYASDGIFIFDMKDNSFTRIDLPLLHFPPKEDEQVYHSTTGRGQIGLARPNASSPGIIVVAAMDGYLYAYDKAGNMKWGTTAETNRSDKPYTTYNVASDGSDNGYKSASVMFSDFNGDGNAEIVTGDRIFDLATGKLLLDCGFLTGKPQNAPLVSVIDVNGDGRPELVWGGNVYSIDIATPQTGTAGNTYTLMTEITDATTLSSLPNSAVTATIPADFDLDGEVDILAYGSAYFYVYNPITAQIKVSQAINPGDRGSGTPFVGDIDGDKYPEIMYGESPDQGGGVYNIVAWDIDGAASGAVKWRKGTSDQSRATGLTLFDFDQNGTFEILYRDQNQLRIFDGTSQATMDNSANTPTIPCYSGTLGEYPITADVDGDGEAEIVVTGAATTSDITKGYVFIFNPGPGARWAPAREVWNQYAYNVVNINKDLSIPTEMFDIAMIMAGPDSLLNTGDDVQPFNGFLKQSTMIDRYGNMVMYAPDVQLAGSPAFVYDAGGDSLLIKITVANNGSSAFQPPLYVTAYRDGIQPADSITTDSITAAIYPGDMYPFTFVIRNLSTLPPFDEILIALNNRGQAATAATECKYGNNDAVTPRSTILLTHNDHSWTLPGMEILIPILTNDTLPPGCPSAAPEIADPPRHGYAIFSGDTVRYASTDPDFAGFDTLTYRLACSGDTAFACVYVYVAEKPDNVSDAGCFVDPPRMNWGITQDWRSTDADVSDHVIPLVGDMNGDSVPEIVVYTIAGRVASGTPVFGQSRPILRTIAIYDTRTHQRKIIDMPVITGSPAATVSEYEIDTYGMIKTPDNGVLIIVPTMDYRLHAFDYTGGEIWASDSVYGTVPGDHSAAIGFADFNHDGVPEAYINNRIFNANTGKLLAKATGGTNRGGAYACWSGQTNWKQSASTAADVLGTGSLQLILGNEIYEVTINDANAFDGNTLTMVKTVSPPVNVIADGHTQVADFNRDGFLDVFISNRTAGTGGTVHGYVWDVHSNAVSSPFAIPAGTYAGGGKSIPLVADFDGDSIPDVLIQTQLTTNAPVFRAFKYHPANRSFSEMWSFTPSEDSYSTSATLFDFNLDGIKEIVLQDQEKLRIVNAGTGIEHTHLTFGSGTVMQFPVVADPYGKSGDRSARIISIGAYQQTGGGLYQGSLNILKADSAHWAYARPVWNQVMYNSVNVNDDVSVAAYPVNPATFFPGRDGMPGTADDVQPYNAFLKQAEILNVDGDPLWPAPDAVFDKPQTLAIRDGDSVSVNICILNQGDAALGSPVYATLYKDSVKDENIITTDSINSIIQPGETDCLTIGVRNIKPHLPFVQLIVRLNDRDGTYPFLPECKCDDSIQIRISPALDLMMRKEATLNGRTDTGRYANPVSVLYNENIRYEITAVNANLQSGNTAIIITDTLPPYLKYKGTPFSSNGGNFYQGTIDGTPPRDTVRWHIPDVTSLATVTVAFDATPESGASASQPLYINSAWVQVSDTLFVKTNSTYHQGAGISMVTFSASAGGHIFNAGEQALDYRTSPRAGIRIVPDSGYVFAGWSHDGYVSLRGEAIPADSGIMNYDRLVIYGSVELRADFEPLRDDPEEKEKEITQDRVPDTGDKVWSNGSRLYIRTKEGSTVHVYTPDGILRRSFVTAADGVTALRLERGVYVVTLNGGEFKIVVSG